MSSKAKLETKFKLLLNKFMIQDHQVIDDTCLEKLLSHLSKESHGPELLKLAECRGFCECSLHAFEKGVIGESVLAFSLRLHGLIIQNEEVFGIPELQESTKNITLSPRWMVTKNASLQFSFVQMVGSLLTHKTGNEWLQSSVVWKTVNKLYEKNSSIYVARECQSFLSQFVQKTASTNEEVAEQILKSALDTISGNKSDLTTALDLILTVLELALKENERHVCKVLQPKLGKACNDLLGSDIDNTVLIKVTKIQLLLIYCAVEPNDESLNQLEGGTLELVGKLIALKNIPAVQTITNQCQFYWKTLKPRVKHLKRPYKYDMQIVYIQLMPMMEYDDTNANEVIQNFFEKLCSCTSTATQHTGCCFRKLCFSGDSENQQKIACRSIHSLLQLKDVFEREVAIFVFRALMCIVAQLVKWNATEMAEMQNQGLMRTTLEALIKMMDHFHFTWADSVETIEILQYMQLLLCQPTLEDRQISPLLQIVRRAVEEFLPPNLALLTNTIEGSSLQELGPQLFKCMHSCSWEVRDSALEVVTVLARISFDKYPAFQEHLIQHNLCSLASAMASGDKESYVRVSALACLREMIAVPRFWESCLHDQRIPEMLTKILCNDSEGIVRQEAVLLVNAMFQFKRLNSDEKERMYLVMASAAASDFHWEVKVNALKFWETTIRQQLTCQGMVDGRFPDVTFSGSPKRITTLDRREIQARLKKVLDELARIRCLAILLGSLNDPDLQVARKTAEILNMVFGYLEEHELLKKSTSQSLDSPAEEMTMDAPQEQEVSSGDSAIPDADSVINEIVELSDLALLATVYDNQLSLSEEQAPNPVLKGVNVVSADEFLLKAHAMNLDFVITNREEWLFKTTEHLESLLTDMLEAREFKHTLNKMDCY